jgi:hypothetical protein
MLLLNLKVVGTTEVLGSGVWEWRLLLLQKYGRSAKYKKREADQKCKIEEELIIQARRWELVGRRNGAVIVSSRRNN